MLPPEPVIFTTKGYDPRKAEERLIKQSEKEYKILPEPSYEDLILVYRKGQSQAEIAKKLHIKIATLRDIRERYNQAVKNSKVLAGNPDYILKEKPTFTDKQRTEFMERENQEFLGDPERVKNTFK